MLEPGAIRLTSVLGWTAVVWHLSGWRSATPLAPSPAHDVVCLTEYRKIVELSDQLDFWRWWARLLAVLLLAV